MVVARATPARRTGVRFPPAPRALELRFERCWSCPIPPVTWAKSANPRSSNFDLVDWLGRPRDTRTTREFERHSADEGEAPSAAGARVDSANGILAAPIWLVGAATSSGQTPREPAFSSGPSTTLSRSGPVGDPRRSHLRSTPGVRSRTESIRESRLPAGRIASTSACLDRSSRWGRCSRTVRRHPGRSRRHVRGHRGCEPTARCKVGADNRRGPDDEGRSAEGRRSG